MDISLYNVLARENTRLLQLYSELDSRCRVLGYMVKLFAKVRHDYILTFKVYNSYSHSKF